MFLVSDYPDLTNLIWEARNINDSMSKFVLQRISDIMKERNIKDVYKVGLYGLTYKEDVDDTRESLGMQLLENMDKLSNKFILDTKKYLMPEGSDYSSLHPGLKRET